MTDEELKRLFETARQENAGAHAETRGHIDTASKRLDGRIDELRRHFDVVGERLESRIDALAESIAVVDEKVDRRIDDLEQRMECGFRETQAVIEFSHLHRRVERLEFSTH